MPVFQFIGILHPIICNKVESISNVHLIMIADENGIPSVFTRLKATLAERSVSHLTLIYALFSESARPLFSAELQSFEKQFSSLLEVKMIAYEKSAAIMLNSIKEAIEVVINSNIQPVMHFYTRGNMEWVDRIRKTLVFLGIGEKQITTEFLESTI